MSHKERAHLELQDIFNRHFEKYNRTHSLSRKQLNVVTHIRQCRTLQLGAHKRECDQVDCSYIEISANSCRDRHCPK